MNTIDQAISDFMFGKSEQSIKLGRYFMKVYVEMGEITTHATKTMIAFKAQKNFAYIIRFGKDYIDIVLPFKTVYADHLCFSKIVHVPGSTDYNHHIRMYNLEDVNDEVKHYMKLAYANGERV